uniref:Uncharacterized protein n=1 Tax=Haptolina ericina TaxID=156174 RepID=A0A7S3F055_9EUKA
MASSDAAIYLNAYGTRPAPFLLAQLTVCHMDAYCESQAVLTHRYSCHPSISQETSSGPSLLSTGDVPVHWAATCGLLDNSGAAPLSGHRARRRWPWLTSRGCCHVTWWQD